MPTLFRSPGEAFSHSRWDASWPSLHPQEPSARLCARCCALRLPVQIRPHVALAGCVKPRARRVSGSLLVPGLFVPRRFRAYECPERAGPCVRGPQASPLAEALPMSHPSEDKSRNLRLSSLSTCRQDNGFRVLGSLFYRGFQLPPSSLWGPVSGENLLTERGEADSALREPLIPNLLQMQIRQRVW